MKETKTQRKYRAFRLSDEEHRKLRELARVNHRTMSDQLAVLIEAAYKRRLETEGEEHEKI